MNHSQVTGLPHVAGIRIGVDIGGTKTHLRFYDIAGTPRDLVLATAEWRVRNWEEDAIALLALAARLSEGRLISSMAVGAHGCDDASECAAFQNAFSNHAAFPVQVVNDAELLPAAFDLQNEIGLVAGTGSIAVSRNRDGRMLVAGGWGWVIGDEGSASGLMREAGRAVARHLDCGGSAGEPLVQRLFEALEITNAARIGSAIGKSGGASALGRYAHIIFEAAEIGSLIARDVIQEGGKELAELVARLKQNGSDATTVVAGGSVIVAQPMLWNVFADQVATRLEGRIVAKLYPGPPVEGACRLAAAIGNTTVDAMPVSSFPS